MKKINKIDDSIGDRLLVLIKQSFGTQTEFAQKMGKSVQAISRIITTNKLSIEFINELVELMPDLDLNWLIKGEVKVTNKEEESKPYECKYQIDLELRDLLKSQQRTIEYLSQTINVSTNIWKDLDIKK